MLKRLAILVLLGGAISACAMPLPEKFIAAEIQVESGGKDNIVGDNGAAIGCLQIHRACHTDSKISGNYSNCFNRAYSIQVMEAYLTRYEPAAIKLNDFESLSKCWNAGPNWRKKTGQAKTNLENYWRKIQAQLK